MRIMLLPKKRSEKAFRKLLNSRILSLLTEENTWNSQQFCDNHTEKLKYRACRNKRPGRLIFSSNKKTFQNPSKIHRFYVLPPLKNHPSNPVGFVYSPPLKNHPSKPIGFVYSPLWKPPITAHWFYVLPPFEKSPIKAHRFCVLPPFEKITHQNPAVIVFWLYYDVNGKLTQHKSESGAAFEGFRSAFWLVREIPRVWCSKFILQTNFH